MSTATETTLAGSTAASEPIPQRVLLGGVALTSLAALLLELAWTRLFSVVLFYHFAFLAISLALLGLGSGGVFAYLGKKWLARFRTPGLMACLCVINALTIPVVLEIVLHVPVSLALSRTNLLHLTAIYLASALPFFVTGTELSIVFARASRQIPRLYSADLAGGALACLGVVPLLNWLGGPNTVLFSALMSAFAAAVWAAKRRTKKLLAACPIVLLILIAANHSGKLIDIVYAKGKLRDQSWVEFAQWNAISRIEVDRQGDARPIVIDADASTYIMNADLNHWKGTAWEKDLMSAPAALANVLRPRGAYAIIGPGGGVDVLRALANGSPSITGIEINPIIANTIMRDRYADYSYHLYQRPEVNIHVTDGRSFIRGTPQTFDVVQMTLVDTWASTAAGAFALSENSLYTVEAFRSYFEHLNPDGIIAITRWEFRQPREALRVVSVALEALHQLGVSTPFRNFVVVSYGQLDEDGIPVVVLAKKSAFTGEEETAVKRHLTAYPILNALYLPSYRGPNPFSELILRNDPYQFAQLYPYNVAPVTDNAPFFFLTLKLGQWQHLRGEKRGIDWKVNLGVVVLFALLLISFVAVLAFLVIPLAVRGVRTGPHAVSLLYFVAVGLGYILVEIVFIQRFVLFLGHPTYALTVVVFLLLLSSGAGSLTSRAWFPHTQRVWLPLTVIAGGLGLYVFLLPGILNSLIGIPFLGKLLVSAGVLAPLGFVMGMPFPTGLGALAGAGTQELPASAADAATENAVEWAWAMNAGASVLGSVLAMFIAIQFGLSATLACGAVAYMSALLLSPTLQPRQS